MVFLTFSFTWFYPEISLPNRARFLKTKVITVVTALAFCWHDPHLVVVSCHLLIAQMFTVCNGKLMNMAICRYFDDDVPIKNGWCSSFAWKSRDYLWMDPPKMTPAVQKMASYAFRRPNSPLIQNNRGLKYPKIIMERIPVPLLCLG